MADLKATSSVHALGEDKPPFGSRFLTDETQVWTKNAWDHVPAPTDQADTIAASLKKQRAAPVPEDAKIEYHAKPAKFWDNFYKNHDNNFFKDRKWLHNEFPELVSKTLEGAGPATIAEIGCGAGNSVFPLLSANKNPELSLLAYDYSHHAVKLVQHHPLYLSPPLGTIHAEPWDLSSPSLPPGLEQGSVDIVMMIFVLSALHPSEWRQAMTNVHAMLKPGGKVMIRDYGRYDLTQLRFKGGRLLDDNFYIRGDKTRVYFFELDELALLFTGRRAPEGTRRVTTSTEIEEEGPLGRFTPTSEESIPTLSNEEVPEDVQTGPVIGEVHPSLPLDHHHPLFVMEQLGVDHRLLINRKRQLKMYRVWMQGKFQKL